MDHYPDCRGREQRVPQPGDGCEVRGDTEQGQELQTNRGFHYMLSRIEIGTPTQKSGHGQNVLL